MCIITQILAEERRRELGWQQFSESAQQKSSKLQNNDFKFIGCILHFAVPSSSAQTA
jgi:methyltransferase-like protein